MEEVFEIIKEQLIKKLSENEETAYRKTRELIEKLEKNEADSYVGKFYKKGEGKYSTFTKVIHVEFVDKNIVRGTWETKLAVISFNEISINQYVTNVIQLGTEITEKEFIENLLHAMKCQQSLFNNLLNYR